MKRLNQLLIAPLALVGLCAWDYRPLPRQVHTLTSHGRVYRFETTRRYELLPLPIWDIHPQHQTVFNASGGATETAYKFGFVAVVDTVTTHYASKHP